MARYLGVDGVKFPTKDGKTQGLVGESRCEKKRSQSFEHVFFEMKW
ncbi:hypothetical protein ACQBEH_05330 [Brevibacillus laterosporus]